MKNLDAVCQSEESNEEKCCPAVSAYKLQKSEIYYGTIRIMPSCIMTGRIIFIEKSKFEMGSEDIAAMLRVFQP